MRIDAGRLILEADTAGRITSVAPRRRPDRPFLAEVDLGACRRAGVDVGWTDSEVEIDVDEVAVGGAPPVSSSRCGTVQHRVDDQTAAGQHRPHDDLLDRVSLMFGPRLDIG